MLSFGQNKTHCLFMGVQVYYFKGHSNSTTTESPIMQITIIDIATKQQYTSINQQYTQIQAGTQQDVSKILSEPLRGT